MTEKSKEVATEKHLELKPMEIRIYGDLDEEPKKEQIMTKKEEKVMSIFPHVNLEQEVTRIVFHGKKLDYLVEQVEIRIKRTGMMILEIGYILLKIRELTSGRFEGFIKQKFDFSLKTAHNFMNVYKACAASPEIVRLLKPSLLYQIAAPSFPESWRDLILSLDEEQINNKLVKEIIRKVKDEELTEESPEIVELVKQHQIHVKLAPIHKAITKCIDILQNHRNTIVPLMGDDMKPILSVLDELLSKLKAGQKKLEK